MSKLSGGDVVVVIASLVGVIGIAIYSARKSKKNATDEHAESFFLAGRNMPWWICAASLFASNIGTEHFVGQAGAAATGGIAVGLYEWSAAYLLLALGWIFAPVYLRCQLSTIPEYLEGRYNRHCRVLFVLMTMMAYVLSKIGASVYAGSVLLEVVTGFSMWGSAPLVILATALYTAIGGLSVVMLTDTVQMVIFLFGGLIGTGLSLHLVGGLSGLFKILEERNLGYMTHMVRSVKDRDYPWPGMLIGMPITSVWYWCIDQEMAQRVLSARSLEDAQIGTAVAAFLKVVPVFITVVPGMVARALYEQCKEYGTFPAWCIESNEDLSNDNVANRAYPLLVLREFPSGVRGIMVASFLAAMMSSLSSVYNSASTVFTYDVYERFWYPQGGAPAARLVMVGQGTTIALTVLTFLWLPIIETSDKGLYLVAQAAMTHLAPPVVAIFLLGLFWRRANAQGATTGFIAGGALGIIRWIVTLFSQNLCEKNVVEGPTGKLQNLSGSTWFSCLNFNYFAIFLFTFTILVVVIVSLMTPPPSDAQLHGRMYGNLASRGRMLQVPPSSPGTTRNVGASNDDEIPVTLPYNPFADQSGSGQDATSNLDRDNGGTEVTPYTLDSIESKDKREQGWVHKHGKQVANGLGLSVMVVIAGLILAFH